jgi:hypothetical protein
VRFRAEAGDAIAGRVGMRAVKRHGPAEAGPRHDGGALKDFGDKTAPAEWAPSTLGRARPWRVRRLRGTRRHHRRMATVGAARSPRRCTNLDTPRVDARSAIDAGARQQCSGAIHLGLLPWAAFYFKSVRKLKT